MKKENMAPATGATSNTPAVNRHTTPCPNELCIDLLLKAGHDGIDELKTPTSACEEVSLPTIISQLKLQYGLKIKRNRVTCWEGANGITHITHYTRYLFSSYPDAEKALFLLIDLREKRGNQIQDEETELYLDYMHDFANSDDEPY